MKKIILGVTASLIVSCFQNYKSSNGDYDIDDYESEDIEETTSSYSDESEGYEDGTYEAEIHYYNPNTGTSSTYTLDVDVEDNELVKIHWNNGGWLDDSHFTPSDISNGSTSFTSDEGYEYEVEILE